MKGKPLTGLTILITRPTHQAISLCKLLEDNGARTIVLPTLFIQPPHNMAALNTILKHIDQYDMAIVLSANAVPALTSSTKQLAPLTVIAIGSGTKKALEKNNIHVDIIPEIYSSAGLLTLPLLNNVTGKSIVIFCGENGKSLLKKTLQKRGAYVDEAITYRRECPTLGATQLNNVKLQSPDIIVSTSPESLRNLVEIFPPARAPWIYQKRLITISDDMAKLAIMLGFKQSPTVAKNATDSQVLEAVLRSCYNPLCDSDASEGTHKMTAAPPPTSQNKPEHVRPKTTLPVSVAALILALVAVFTAGYTWSQLSKSQSDSQDRVVTLQQSMSQLKQEVEQNQLQTQSALLKNQKNISQLMSQSGDGSAQEAVAESAYLIRLAHLHLTLDNNITLGIQLLKMAAQRLDSVTSPLATRLKVAIAHDLASLSALPQINLTNLITQLDQINAKLVTLPTQPQTSNQIIAPTPTENTTNTWWDRTKRNVGSLKGLFIVRHFDEPIEPLLTPQESVFLKENIQLKISQAQWAVLHQSPALYRQSLNLAVQWLDQYGQNHPATEQIITKLQALAVIDITPEIPSTLQSLNALSNTGNTAQ